MQNPNNPFPATLPDGTIVIDEKCRCGHLRSEHQSALRGAAFGHGRCKKSRFCGCQKFSWAERIYKGVPNTPKRKK